MVLMTMKGFRGSQGFVNRFMVRKTHAIIKLYRNYGPYDHEKVLEVHKVSLTVLWSERPIPLLNCIEITVLMTMKRFEGSHG